ncbi:TPA: hypothetical protein TVE87_001726 [Streptococcus equi subsp. zooepidemicus]|uniref:hypothetical protein n=1 Tax=Streptococcus equi TaxID=1336 RepID=UPI00294B7A1F|nr:hypothetical protein [Streptococcus equi]WOK56739.1 hypothetical protein RIM63_07590 [Streptococcus equi subsp. zooepidemicus]HEL1075759.1 hypothetical protein [Streptococcus equi subsp. zooepidemicus]
MQSELNLTPTESIIVIVVCLFILALIWNYDNPQKGADTSLDIEPIETPKDYVRERYGAYLWLAGKRFN